MKTTDCFRRGSGRKGEPSLFVFLKISRAHKKVTSRRATSGILFLFTVTSPPPPFLFHCLWLTFLSFHSFAFMKFRLSTVHIYAQVSNHFMGASLNTTCGMEICQSSMRPREGGRRGCVCGGGWASITENGIRYEPLEGRLEISSPIIF